jgi:hypothetical protein
MSTGNDALILLRSTSHAIKAERELIRRSIACRLIPVPRNISSGCGICMQIACSAVAEATEVFGAAGIDIERIVTCDLGSTIGGQL